MIGSSLIFLHHHSVSELYTAYQPQKEYGTAQKFHYKIKDYLIKSVAIILQNSNTKRHQTQLRQ